MKPRDRFKIVQQCVQDAIGTDHKQPCRCNGCAFSRWIVYITLYQEGYGWPCIAARLGADYQLVRHGCLRGEELLLIDREFRKLCDRAVAAVGKRNGKESNAGIH